MAENTIPGPTPSVEAAEPEAMSQVCATCAVLLMNADDSHMEAGAAEQIIANVVAATSEMDASPIVVVALDPIECELFDCLGCRERHFGSAFPVLAVRD